MQNTSHAVMAQRHEAQDSLDFFPTPPWATRALCEWLNEHTDISTFESRVWESACGEGHMARPLDEYFGAVRASDVHNYGYGDVIDFFHSKGPGQDWIITNPPFNLAEQFARWGLECARDGVALLVRTSFLESVGRYERLFSSQPPTYILQFTERVPMHKGRLDPKGSTATSYCWLVWRKPANTITRFYWLAPCRKRLERVDDYVL